jgi:hypothetical protein
MGMKICRPKYSIAMTTPPAMMNEDFEDGVELARFRERAKSDDLQLNTARASGIRLHALCNRILKAFRRMRCS